MYKCKEREGEGFLMSVLVCRIKTINDRRHCFELVLGGMVPNQSISQSLHKTINQSMKLILSFVCSSILKKRPFRILLLNINTWASKPLES